MATTEDALTDRVRAVLTTLTFREAQTLDFTHDPEGAEDKRFVVAYQGETPIGHVGFHEEARGTLNIQLTRAIADDYPTARKQLLQDARKVRKAIVRDGAITSGEYAVEDAAAVSVSAPPGANYLVGALRVTVNFEAVL